MGSDDIQSILIVGGGTTGWMAAAWLSRFAPHVTLTLIESPEITQLSVGESTNRISQRFNHALGIDARHFLRRVDGTLKLGIRFEGFAKRSSVFHHPFGSPVSEPWRQDQAERAFQTTALCQTGRIAPDLLAHGYHVDTYRYTGLLRRWCLDRGVTRLQKTIEQIVTEDYRIASIEGHTADLYIDCTGFRSLLLGHVLGQALIPLSDRLLVDAAVALSVPYVPEVTSLDPVTTCTAMKSGWMWTIPLWTHRSIGYCYSRRHTTPEEAEVTLRAHYGNTEAPCRHLQFVPGRRARFRVNNCVALGPAAGFIEPLESTGISLAQADIMSLCTNLGDLDHWAALAEGRFDRTADFIQTHYHLSEGPNTRFWQDSRRAPLSSRLAEVIEGLYNGNLAVVDGDPCAFYRARNWNVVMSGLGCFSGRDVTDSAPPLPNTMNHYEWLARYIHCEVCQ